MSDYYPKRIVCLTEETTEMLYILGEEDRIVGISGFAMRPPQARKEKPKVSTFTSANIDEIMGLNPDLVLGFSDLQADIAKDLIKKGINVYIFNQRSVEEIFGMIQTLGALVGKQNEAQEWVNNIEEKIELIKKEVDKREVKPKVYFEEWKDPIITGIQWVSEIIEIAGGEECFPEFTKEKLAKNRIVSNPMEVVNRNPDIILGSWCGKQFKIDQVVAREGWAQIDAIKNNQIFEIKSAEILQPGPAALTDGLDAIKSIIDNWHLNNLSSILNNAHS